MTEETKPVEREAFERHVVGFYAGYAAALERAAALLEEEVDEEGGYADGVIGLVRSLAEQIRALKGRE